MLSYPPPKRDLKKALRSLFRDDQVSLLDRDRLSYGRDCNSKAILQIRHHRLCYPPDAIVWPEDILQIVNLVQWCQQHEVPLIPFGGGSGVCGGTWAVEGGIALDVKRMNQVSHLDLTHLQVTAQTGIGGEVLERHLNAQGVTLRHFPSSIYSATLGGYLACRSAGQLSTQYGKIEDMVTGMEVVLPQGEGLHLSPEHHPTGEVDLKELFMGSEGTLGIITEATLKIHRLPEEEKFCAFRFGDLKLGLRAIQHLLQLNIFPAVVRLYDEVDSLIAKSYDEAAEQDLPCWEGWSKQIGHWVKKLALYKPHMANQITGLLPTGCLLILGFEGLQKIVETEAAITEELFKTYHAKSLGEGPGLYWKRHRYDVSYKLSPLFDEGFFADTMEVATTWDNLLPLYHKVRTSMSPYALVLAHFSHAYQEGCSIYFTFAGYQPTLETSEALYDKIWDKALKACFEAGGTISHHHGVGLLKATYMKKEWGVAHPWLCKIKKQLDPNNIMNPGKLGFSA